MKTSWEIERALNKLIGLPLALSFDAGNMKNFHFGVVRHLGARAVGSFALHIQCPWRLQRAGCVLTGSADYYERADGNDDPDWDPDTAKGNLQAQVLQQVLAFPAGSVNGLSSKRCLCVEAVCADDMGGFILKLAGDYQLVVFPCSSRSEEWRLFEPAVEAVHYVMEGGKLRSDEPED